MDRWLDSDIGCAGVVLATFAGLLITVALLAVFVFGPLFEAGCNARWADYQHRWSLIGGCLVQQPDGRWVPEDSFRVVQR